MPENNQDPPLNDSKCKIYIVLCTMYLSILILISPHLFQKEAIIKITSHERQECPKNENIYNAPENDEEINPFATKTIQPKKIVLVNPLITECEKAACLAGRNDGEKGINDSSFIIKECNDENGELWNIFYIKYEECNSLAYSQYEEPKKVTDYNKTDIYVQGEIWLTEKQKKELEDNDVVPDDVGIIQLNFSRGYKKKEDSGKKP